jgi:hypothetical protein
MATMIDPTAAARLPTLAIEIARARTRCGNIHMVQHWQLNDAPLIRNCTAYLRATQGNQALFDQCDTLAGMLDDALSRLGNFTRLWPLEAYGTQLSQLATMVVNPSTTQPWASKVVAAGGAISDAFRARIDNFAGSLISGGVWPLLADAWMLHCENMIQALVSLKLARLGVAVNAPTLQVLSGVKFDGVANYIDTGFIPANDGPAVGMTINACRIAAREAVDLAANAYTLGTFTGSARSLAIKAHNAPTTAAVEASGGAGGVATLITQSSASIISASRTGPTTLIARQDGQPLSVTPHTTWATFLPTNSLWFGGRNNAGALNVPKACTLAYASSGALLTDAQAVAEATAVNNFIAAG